MLENEKIYQHYKQRIKERAEQLQISYSIQKWIALMENGNE